MNPPDQTKKEIINTVINKEKTKYFQYVVTVTLNHKEIIKHAERITKMKPFMDTYNWEGNNYASEKDDCKNIEKNNLTIALNALYKLL